MRREAEIIRQVRESDADFDHLQSTTAHSSPTLLPTVPGLDGPLEGVPGEGSESGMSLDSSNTVAVKGLFGAFNIPASKNSGGRGYWSNLESYAHTTPPPFFARASSSAISDDINIDRKSVV